MSENTSTEVLNKALLKSFDKFYAKHIVPSQDWLQINEKLQLFSNNIEEFLDDFEKLHDKINQGQIGNFYQIHTQHALNFNNMWSTLTPLLTKRFGVDVENKKLVAIAKLQILNSGLKRKKLSELFMVAFLHTPGHNRFFRSAVEGACTTSDNMDTKVFELIQEIFINLSLTNQYLIENPKEVRYLHNYGAAFPSTVSATFELMLGIILNKTDKINQKKKQAVVVNGENRSKELIELFIKNNFFNETELQHIIKKSFLDTKFVGETYHLIFGQVIKLMEELPDFEKKLMELFIVWATNRKDEISNKIIFSYFSSAMKKANMTLDLKECAKITKSCHYFGNNEEAAKLIYTSIEPQSAHLLSKILTSDFLPINKAISSDIIQNLASIYEKYLVENAIGNEKDTIKIATTSKKLIKV